jgi:hypothetical protein
MAFDLAWKAAAVFLITYSVPTLAQDGHHGIGHDKWHSSFYSKLMRKDGKGSWGQLKDLSPTPTPPGGEQSHRLQPHPEPHGG